MNIKEVSLIKGGADPEVEITFGHAQVGKYKVDLLDEYGFFSDTVQIGTNVDGVDDRFPVSKKADDMDGYYLSWDLIIMAPVEGPGQLYSAKVELIQGDQRQVIFDEPGAELSGTKYISGLAKFVLKAS